MASLLKYVEKEREPRAIHTSSSNFFMDGFEGLESYQRFFFFPSSIKIFHKSRLASKQNRAKPNIFSIKLRFEINKNDVDVLEICYKQELIKNAE